MRLTILAVLFCALCIGEAVAAEMSSDNYRIESSVISGGGGASSSSSYQLFSTIGQPTPLMNPADPPFSEHFDLYPGFLYTTFSRADTDGDTITDIYDNCTLVANFDQRDTDGDDYGNMCDGDLNNDGNTNTLDLNIYKMAHRTCAGVPNYNEDADFNGGGCVNTLDLNIYKTLHRKPPGPSGTANP